MKKDFKIGDTVYVYENWSGEIVKAVVSKKSKNGVYINYQYFVDDNGKELNRFIGSSYRKFNEIWDSVAEALNIKKERNNKIIQEYLKEIKNIEDLVKPSEVSYLCTPWHTKMFPDIPKGPPDLPTYLPSFC